MKELMRATWGRIRSNRLLFAVFIAKKLVTVGLFLFSLTTHANDKESYKVDDLVQQYPNEKAVVLSKKDHFFVEVKKNTFSVHCEISEEMMYLTDNAQAYASNSLYYSSFSSIDKLEATSYLPKEKPGKYQEVKVENFGEADMPSRGIFYDDSKVLSFNFDGVVKGAKSSYSYVEEYTDPKFLGKNFFVYGVPALNSEVAITFPEEVEIGYQLFNVDTNEVTFIKEEKRGEITYRWIGKNLEPRKSFGNSPNYSYYGPHIILYLKEVKMKKHTEKVLPDVAALYNWYYSLVKDVNKEENEILKGIVDSLVNDKQNDDDKARTIFNWVQDNIKYVAFEDGMGGFVPRPASLVCDRRYGDCKDMASIITEMLKYADVPANLTWIGSRDIPYRYTEVNTPSVDNHMIASYKNKKGQTVFLDAVGYYTPYGYPTAFIQGKEALISWGADSFELYQVPIIPKEKNFLYESVKMQLGKDGIEGTAQIKAQGYSKLDFVYPLLDKNDNERKDKLRAMVQKGSNKFLIDKADFKGIAERDSVLEIDYRFNLRDYVQENGSEMYVNLHLEKFLKNEKIDIEKREGIPVEFEYLQQNMTQTSFKIPTGYKVSYIPENTGFESPDFGFDIFYEQRGQELIMTFEYYNNLLLLEEKNFESWNQMVKELSKAYKEVAIFKKI